MRTLNLDQAERLDLEYKTNGTIAFSVDITDADGLPFDLTGNTARMRILNAKDESILYEFASGDELTISSGNIAVNIVAGAITLDIGSYYYTLERVVGSNVYTLVYGVFNRGKLLNG